MIKEYISFLMIEHINHKINVFKKCKCFMILDVRILKLDSLS